MKDKIGFAALIILVLVAPFAHGDEEVNENPVTFEGHFLGKSQRIGTPATFLIEMEVAPRHHAYKDMIKVQVSAPAHVKADIVDVTPTHAFKDKFSEKVREGVEGHGTVRTSFQLPEDLKAGKQVFKVDFSYQACGETYCLFPKTVHLEVPANVEAAQAGSIAPDTSSPQPQDGFSRALAKGKAWAFFAAFIGGFLTSLTPCVFPMIPITISIIGARSTKSPRARSFGLSVSYVLGIALTYSLLGVAAAMTGAFFGAALSNPIVVSFIAVVFVAMALSMFGFFEIQVPAFLRNSLGGKNTGSGFGGAFLAGLFSGIVASPCIGPVLVSILTYVAQSRNAFFGFGLLFTFAMGMGILFIVLGTFSGLVSKIPRSGPWMETIKYSFGLVFIALAYYYVYPILSQRVFFILLALGFILAASYFGAFMEAHTPRQRIRKGLMMATFVAGMSYLVLGITGTEWVGRLRESQQAASVNWVPYSDQALSEARKSGKPVIIDFYADWCVACHELDEFTYKDKSVVERSKGFVLLKVDATTPTEKIKELQATYKVMGLPTVVFINSAGSVQPQLSVTGFIKAGEFLEEMESLEKL